MKKLKTYTVCRTNGKEICKVSAIGIKAAALQFIKTRENPAEWLYNLPKYPRWAEILHRHKLYNQISHYFIVFQEEKEPSK